jgi:hypothetical protein
MVIANNTTTTTNDVNMTAPLVINCEPSTQYTLGNYPYFPNTFPIDVVVKLDETYLSNTCDNVFSIIEKIMNELVGENPIIFHYDPIGNWFVFEYTQEYGVEDNICPDEDDVEVMNSFSLEYILHTITKKLGKFKNHRKVDFFAIVYRKECCRNNIELYKYIRPITAEAYAIINPTDMLRINQ